MNKLKKQVDVEAVKAAIAQFRVDKRKKGKIGIGESQLDFIKRIHGYKCTYCKRVLSKKQVKADVVPTYYVQRGDTLERIANYYKTSIKQLLVLNPELNTLPFEKVKYIRMPSKFGLKATEYGVVYCNSCRKIQSNVRMDHLSFMKYIESKKLEARKNVTAALREKVFKRDKHKCVYCQFVGWKHSPQNQKTIDHKKPVSCGGTSVEENLVTSCLYHNLSKQNKNYEEYMRILSNQKKRIL